MDDAEVHDARQTKTAQVLPDRQTQIPGREVRQTRLSDHPQRTSAACEGTVPGVPVPDLQRLAPDVAGPALPGTEAAEVDVLALYSSLSRAHSDTARTMARTLFNGGTDADWWAEVALDAKLLWLDVATRVLDAARPQLRKVALLDAALALAETADADPRRDDAIGWLIAQAEAQS